MDPEIRWFSSTTGSTAATWNATPYEFGALHINAIERWEDVPRPPEEAYIPIPNIAAGTAPAGTFVRVPAGSNSDISLLVWEILPTGYAASPNVAPPLAVTVRIAGGLPLGTRLPSTTLLRSELLEVVVPAPRDGEPLDKWMEKNAPLAVGERCQGLRTDSYIEDANPEAGKYDIRVASLEVAGTYVGADRCSRPCLLTDDGEIVPVRKISRYVSQGDG